MNWFVIAISLVSITLSVLVIRDELSRPGAPRLRDVPKEMAKDVATWFAHQFRGESK